MGQDVSPYDSAIADLEARIQYFQNLLDGLKQLRAQPDGTAAAASVNASRTSGSDAEISHDTFFGMTIGDAAKKYLAMAKHTKSTSEIAAALQMGGLKHSSKDFATTLRTTLGPKEEFIRVNGEWGLTEWYPGMGRGRKPKPDKKEKRKKPGKKERAEAQAATEEKNSKRPTNPNKGIISPGSIKGRILTLLASNPEQSFSGPEVASKVQAELASTRAALVALFDLGKIDRPEAGKYKAKNSV